MASLRRRLVALEAVAFLLLVVGCFGSSWHSLRYLSTMIGDPYQGTHRFIAVGYVDDQLVGHYNRSQRKIEPRVSWGVEVEKNEPQIWDWISQRIRNNELRMKVDQMNLQNLYNRSTGVHILQRMICCEQSKDGHRRGFHQSAYNGEDYLSFDKETLTWTAFTGPALLSKREWDANLVSNEDIKSFLEEICIVWLQKFLYYGKASLLKTERPTVTVSLKTSYDGLETLICQAHGFYPKQIDAIWQKDGEVWEHETFRGGVVPNSDGTYYVWLSIKIHPKDRDRYRCHVEHDSLLEPLDVAWEGPVFSKLGLILGVLVITAGLFVAGIVFYFWRRWTPTRQPINCLQQEIPLCETNDNPTAASP